LSDITLSPGAVAAVTALLGGLVAAIGVLFFQLISSKNSQINREQELTNRLLPAVEEGNRTLQRLVELILSLQRDLISRRGPGG
jgi:hypothetical protein